MTDSRDAWAALAADRGLAEPPKVRRRDESDLQARILELAALTGWRAMHVPDSRRVQGSGAAGFPDLVLCRPPRLIFAELKSPDGRVQPEQAAWHNALELCGAEVCVWREVDWPAIEARLTERRGR